VNRKSQEPRIASIVARLRAGVSPVCDTVPPAREDFGVLTLTAVTAGDVDRRNAKRIDTKLVKGDWPVVRKGTILITRGNGSRNLVGACVLVEKDEPRLIPPDTVWVLEIAEGRSARFLVEFLRSPRGRKAIHEISRGSSGIWKISQESFLSLRLPPTSEDIEVAVDRVAKEFDATLRRLAELIDAKRIFRRGLMQQLLTGQNRFPEFRGRPWEEVHLGDIFNERNESNRPDLPLLSVTNDRGVIPRSELDKRDTSNPDKSKYKRVAVGDIAYNTMRMWQGVSALSSLEGIISPAYTVAIPTERIPGPFAKHLFKFPPVINLFHRHSQGLVDDTLNLKFDRLAKIKLIIPRDPAEQSRIASILDLCDVEIELLVALRKQFQNRKCALLSKLLSGEIEVPA